jgi:hypothetical protein
MKNFVENYLSPNTFSNACSYSGIYVGFVFPSYLILHCFDWILLSEVQIPLRHPQTQLRTTVSTKMSLSQRINFQELQSNER